MRTVTKGRVLGVLAETPSDRFGFLYDHFHRGALRSLMAPIAERLMGGLSAGAPPVGAGFHFLDLGLLRANFGRFHGEGTLTNCGSFSRERTLYC